MEVLIKSIRLKEEVFHFTHECLYNPRTCCFKFYKVESLLAQSVNANFMFHAEICQEYWKHFAEWSWTQDSEKEF